MNEWLSQWRFKNTRAEIQRRKECLAVAGVFQLDPKGGNETTSCEKFGWRRSGAYPMKRDPEIYKARNANCHSMDRIRLRVIWARRGRGHRSLTACLMGARRHALRMSVHCGCSHPSVRRQVEPVGSHTLLWGPKHGMGRRSTHDRTRPHRTFGLVGPHVHIRRHGHGCVVFACCSRSVTIGRRLV